MTLVMFDIDGTLTQTNEIDASCFAQTLQEVFGFTDINTDWAAYQHCTDSQILEELCRLRLGRPPSPTEVSSAQARFLALLDKAAQLDPFRQVPGAGEFLYDLVHHRGSSLAVSLASGGWECSARLKLERTGLASLNLPGAYSDDAQTREGIMRTSLAKAAAAYSQDSFDSVVHIGDGVWDARACRNLGFPFIGIADAPAAAQKLLLEGAVHVFSDYRDPTALITVLQASKQTH